jgi:hypothetical protein
MQTGLVHLHNTLRWIILILLILSIVKAYTGWKSKSALSDSTKKLWLFTMVATHITLLLGLYQWLAGRYGMLTTSLPEGTSFMKDKFYRFYWLEHPLMMILAIVFITVGRRMAKSAVTDIVKHRKAFLFFLIGLILILAAIPWPFREVIGRGYFPGM